METRGQGDKETRGEGSRRADGVPGAADYARPMADGLDVKVRGRELLAE